MDTNLNTPLIYAASKADHNIEVVEDAVLHVSPPSNNHDDKKEERSEEDNKHNDNLNAMKFWIKCIVGPLVFIWVNMFIMITILKLLHEKYHANSSGGILNDDSARFSAILKNRVQGVRHCYLAFAFFFYIDAVILLKFAIHIERMVENYWKDLGSEVMKKSVDLQSEEEGAEEQHVLPTIGSRISLDYVYVFASHKTESFLQKDTDMKKEKVKKSTFLSIVYLLATLCMLFSVFNLFVYGIMRGTSTGGFCFINTWLGYRYQNSHQRPLPYECGSYNLTSSPLQKEYSKLPSTVRSWINETDPHPCREKYTSKGLYSQPAPRSTFVNMIDGDIFFFGSRSHQKSHHLILSKKDDSTPISFPNIFTDSYFIVDKQENDVSEEDENDLQNVSRFCLKFKSYVQAIHSSSHTQQTHGRILHQFYYGNAPKTQSLAGYFCHPSAIDVPAGTFRNISLSNEYTQCRENLEGDLLILMCFDSRNGNNYGYYNPYRLPPPPPPRVALGYNASTMEEVFSHRIELQFNTPPPTSHPSQSLTSSDTISVECLLNIRLILSVAGSASLVISGLALLRVKQSPAGALLLFAGPGLVLAYLPILFVFYHAVPGSLLLSSLLTNKPTRPDWLSREASWWLVYYIIIFFWVLLLVDYDFIFDEHEPLNNVLDTFFAIGVTVVGIALFTLASLVLVSSLRGIELRRPSWLTKRMSFWLICSVAALTCLCADGIFRDTGQRFSFVKVASAIVCICSSMVLMILAFMLEHPIFRILYCCAVFVIAALLIPIGVLGGANSEYFGDCVLLLFLVLILGVVRPFVGSSFPFLGFLCKQLLGKMKIWKKKKKNEIQDTQ